MKRISAVATVALCAIALSVFAQPISFEKVEMKIATPVAKETPPAPGAQEVPLTPETQMKPVTPETMEKSSPPEPGQETLRIITDFNHPPFTFIEKGKRTGFEVDLGDAIGKEMGVKVEWIQKNFNISTYASALEAGSADMAMASITITDKRKRQLAFTEPYFRTSLSVAVQRDVDWRPNAFRTGLKNWLVGVVRGTTAESWARANLAAKIKTYYSPDRLIQALKNSKADKVARGLGLPKKATGFCIIMDQPVMTWALSKRAYRFQIVERDVDHQYYAIAVSKNNTKLLEELNATLERLDKNDVYDKIYEKWYTKAQDLPLFEKSRSSGSSK
jgi:ABC-type amino acid transport substrate-binding protein